MRILALVFCGFLLAATPVRSEGEDPPTLAQVLDEFEHVEKELHMLEQRIPQAIPSERRRLEKQKTDLQQRQETLLDQMEKMVGPLPPAARSDRRRPVEEQLEQGQIRNDAIQERDVEKRLP